jgi:hypothetical protein
MKKKEPIARFGALSFTTTTTIASSYEHDVAIDPTPIDPTPIDPKGVTVVENITFAPELQDLSFAQYYLLPLLDTMKVLQSADPAVLCLSSHDNKKETILEDDNKSGLQSLGAAERSSKWEKQWEKRFQELCEYKETFGNCNVVHPSDWTGNTKLAKWIKRQRYQYKLKEKGGHSTLSDAREVALEGIDFQWKRHKSQWEERFNELLTFKHAFGNCNVPSKFPLNPSVAVWVQSQRRQYKLYMRNEPSHMTKERIQKLVSVGFEWEARTSNNGQAFLESPPRV